MSASFRTTSPLDPEYRRLTIGMVMTIVAVAFEALAISTVMPTTAKDLDGLSLYGWVFSAFTLAQLIGIATAGAHADVHPPARAFMLGLILFGAGLVIGGFSPTMEILILSRAIQGLGAGMIAATAYVIIGRAYPAETLPRMLAIMSSAWVVPGLVGPSIASLIEHVFNWRGVFLLIIPIPIIALYLAMPYVSQVEAGTEQLISRQTILNSILLAAAATVMLAGFTVSPWWLGTAMVIVGFIALARPFARLMPEGILQAKPGLPAAVGGLGLLNFAFFGVSAFLPLAIDDLLHHGSFVIGLTVSSSTITWTAGSWIQSHFASRSSRRKMTSTGLCVLGIAFVLITLAIVLEWPVPALVAIWGLAGIGIGLAYATLTLTILETAPAGGEGKATSAMHLANNLAIAIATGVGGALIALLSDGDEASKSAITLQYVLMIAVVGMCLVVARRLPISRRPTSPQAEPEEGVESLLLNTDSPNSI